MRYPLSRLLTAAALVAAPTALMAQSEAPVGESAQELAPVPAPGAAAAPLPYNGTGMYSGSYSVFGAPGYYGVAYGMASYGIPRTYTAFSSPYGAGYGYGYAPYAYMPGRFGAGLWQPGAGGGGYVDSYSGYRTFSVPHHPEVVPPPLGFYAPGYGPPANAGW